MTLEHRTVTETAAQSSVAGKDGRRTGIPRRPRILLVEDDPEMLRLVAGRLRQAGYEVTGCRDGLSFLCRVESAVARGATLGFDLIISDVRLPGLTGLEVLDLLRMKDRDTPVIAMTAFGDMDVRVRAARLGVIAFFDKPFDVDGLCHTVESIVPPAR